MSNFLQSFDTEPQEKFTALYRIQFRGTVFYSRQYGRVKKRNSYTIMYYDRTNQCKKFAAIEYFLYIKKRIIAVLKPLCPAPCGSCKDHFDLCTSIVDTLSFLHPVSFEDGCVVCFAEDILSKCLFLDFDHVKYVLTFPSSLMFD